MGIHGNHGPTAPGTLREVGIQKGAVNGHKPSEHSSHQRAVPERLPRLENRRLKTKLCVDQTPKKEGVLKITRDACSSDLIQP